MIKKGFTLFETMISVTIFSVLMIIVFNCWMEFQKVSVKNEGKQDTNIKFVNIYRNIDKYVSSSNIRYIKYYSQPNLPSEFKNNECKKKRWIAFLLSRQIDDVNKVDLGKTMNYNKYRKDTLVYNTVLLYLLDYKSGCCGSFENCPHKNLYRYYYALPEKHYIFTAKTNYTFVKELDNIKKIIDDPNIKYVDGSKVDKALVESNIVDLKFGYLKDKLRAYLRLLRISEAERAFKIGTKQLTSDNPESEFQITDETLKKYIENLSWISMPSNNPN